MALSFASPISALGKATTTSTENKGSKKVVYPEHPNAPEGDYEIAPMKIAPPSYEGHVHMPMPFVNGKLAMSLDRIDRTNSEIEFSVDKSWLGNRKIKRLGVASIRWYGFAIDNSGLYEANTFDNEWTIKMFASKADYEGLSMNGQTMSYLYYSLMITLIIMGVFISKKTVCCIGLRGETA